MTVGEFLKNILSLNTWGSRGERAANKPLLILFALGKFESENSRQMSFANIEKSYRNLLLEFGQSSNRTPHPEYAFYRLKNDCDGSLWTVFDPNDDLKENSSGDVRVTDLRKPGVEAGFKPEILELFSQNPDLVAKVSETILAAHFPESLHSDILSLVGLTSPLNFSVSRRRDPKFRPNVLEAYGYQCAVCGFSLKLGFIPIALEAAHIMWHQAGGPDVINNGLSLCSLHHKLFDRGVFTISDEFRVEVSDLVNSTGKHVVLDYDGCKISLPRSSDRDPDPEYLNWHKLEVFRS